MPPQENNENTKIEATVTSIIQILGPPYSIMIKGNNKFFHHKTEGHNRDTSSDPGEKGPFIGHMYPAVLYPDLRLFF